MGNLFSSEDKEAYQDSLDDDERAIVDSAVGRGIEYRGGIEELAQQTHEFLSIPTAEDGKLTWAQKKKIKDLERRYLELESQHSPFIVQMTKAFMLCARADPQNQGRTCSALENCGREFRKSADRTAAMTYLAANMKWMMDLAIEKDGKITELNNKMTAAEAQAKQITPPWFDR